MKILRTIIFFLLAGILGYSVRDCQGYNWKKAGVLSMSRSIAESKQKGVYLWSYRPPQNPYVVNDTLNIHVNEAWLEKVFRIPTHGDYANVSNSEEVQMVMTLKGVNIPYPYLPYSIVKKGTDEAVGKRSILWLDTFDKIPLEDTLKFEVKIPIEESSFAPPVKVIGEFELIRHFD